MVDKIDPTGLATGFVKLGDAIAHIPDKIKEWAASMASSADELRSYSAPAAEQVAQLEYGRRVRQFERGADVGRSAAFAASAGNRLEERVAKISNLIEQLWNWTEGTFAHALANIIDFFDLEILNSWLMKVLVSVWEQINPFGKKKTEAEIRAEEQARRQAMQTPASNLLNSLGGFAIPFAAPSPPGAP